MSARKANLQRLRRQRDSCRREPIRQQIPKWRCRTGSRVRRSYGLLGQPSLTLRLADQLRTAVPAPIATSMSLQLRRRHQSDLRRRVRRRARHFRGIASRDFFAATWSVALAGDHRVPDSETVRDTGTAGAVKALSRADFRLRSMISPTDANNARSRSG